MRLLVTAVLAATAACISPLGAAANADSGAKDQLLLSQAAGGLPNPGIQKPLPPKGPQNGQKPGTTPPDPDKGRKPGGKPNPKYNGKKDQKAQKDQKEKCRPTKGTKC